VEWKKVEKDVRKEHLEGLRRPLRPRPAAGVGRLDAVPAAPHQQDAPVRHRGRQPHRHRAQRLAAVHRRRRQRRIRDPPLRAGERPGRGHHRPAHRHVLQHRDQHLHLDSVQQEARRAQGLGAAHRRQQLLAEDAKSLGSKRKELSDAHIADITRLFGDFVEAEQAIVLDAAGKELGRQILLFGDADPPPPQAARSSACRSPASSRTRSSATPRSPSSALRDEAGKVVLGERQAEGQAPARQQPARHRERAADRDIDAYFAREVLPRRLDRPRQIKVGYEIPFNRHFYVFEPPRSLHEIDEELKGVTANIMAMLEGLAE
jgi:hypothetical protein